MTLSSTPQEEDAEGDVGLQLQVNFLDKAVQRNARLAGKWGQAEKTLSFFPFAPGESFKVEQMFPVVDAVVDLDTHADVMCTFTQHQQGATLLF